MKAYIDADANPSPIPDLLPNGLRPYVPVRHFRPDSLRQQLEGDARAMQDWWEASFPELAAIPNDDLPF